MSNLKQIALVVIVFILHNILTGESASCSSYSTETACGTNTACSWINGGSSYYCACASSVAEDVYFVMDISSSIGSSAWQEDVTFVSDMITTGLTNSSRVGIIIFSSYVSVEYNLTQQQHPRSVLSTFVLDIAYTGGTTYTKSAVQVAIKMFEKFSTIGNPRLLFLITDGKPNPSTLQSPCSLYPTLVAQNISVFIVGVGSAFSSSAVDCLVSDASTDIILATSFSDLTSLRDYTDNVLCPTTIQLTLTEVRATTDATNTCEFIEFYNSGSTVINFKTNPLKISGLVTATLNSSIAANISSGQYVVLYKSGTSPICYDCTCTQNSADRCKNALYIPCNGKNCTFNTKYSARAANYTNWGVLIEDGSDNSVLVNVTFSKSTFPTITSGYSYELQSVSDDDAVGTNWAQSCWDYGTPGQGPLASCSSCKATVCQENGDSKASCNGNQCNCTESNHYYLYGSTCKLVPNVTDCTTTVTKDSSGTLVYIAWPDVSVTNTHYFEVEYPYDSGTTGFATTSDNEHFYIYYDTTVTASSAKPMVRCIVPDNTSTITLDGTKIVYGDYTPCPISTAAPTHAPTPEPTYAIPKISKCNATIDAYDGATIEWSTPTFSYPTTPSSVSSYKIYITCNGANTTYYSTSRVYTNTITGCTITSSTSVSRIAVVAVVDENGSENSALMLKSATSCTIKTSAPTKAPTKTPTKSPTHKPSGHPSKAPTQQPTYADYKITACAVTIQGGATDISVAYTLYTPSQSAGSVTIILYDRSNGDTSPLTSNPSTVVISNPLITDTSRFVVYPLFVEYPSGPNIGATCCNSTCTVSTLTPTSPPTGLPTSRPTSAPTHYPTGFPTGLPTAAPTPFPTYGEVEVSYCNYSVASGSHSFNISFTEPSSFTFPISDAKYKISWNNNTNSYFIGALATGSYHSLTIDATPAVKPEWGIYVTVYFSTTHAQGTSTLCHGRTQHPTQSPTYAPTTPAPTWSQPTLGFDSSQFDGSTCSYTAGNIAAACTITPSPIGNSLRVLRLPATWGYDISYKWDIVYDRRRALSNGTLNTTYFSSATSGSGFIASSGNDFTFVDYTFVGPRNITGLDTYTFTIELVECYVNDSTYVASAYVTYDCTLAEPYQIIITVDYTSDKLQTNNKLGNLPDWIWYAIAAGVLIIPLLSYFGYRYYKKRKMAELLKEAKQVELKDAQDLDNPDNFGGVGDAVAFNPLATGGTHDIASGGQYVDRQIDKQKQNFETAHVDVDAINFKQDFGQVQAVKR